MVTRTGTELGVFAQKTGRGLLVKTYTKPSRYNPRLSFDQYKIVLQRKKHAADECERVRYKDLVKEWGVRQSVIGTALRKGIKQYDYILWKRGEQI
jgi:hypothetical protein